MVGQVVAVLSVANFTPRERDVGTHWIGELMGPKQVWTCSRREKSLTPAGIQTPDSPQFIIPAFNGNVVKLTEDWGKQRDFLDAKTRSNMARVDYQSHTHASVSALHLGCGLLESWVFRSVCCLQRLTTGCTVRGSNPVREIFSAPVRTGPGAHPAFCTMGTGLVIPLLPLWAFVACSRVNFTFTFTLTFFAACWSCQLIGRWKNEGELKRGNDTDWGKPNGTDTNLSECHKSYTDRPGIEFESPQSATNSVSQRMAQMEVFWGRDPCGLTSGTRLLPSTSLLHAK